ncbi:MAG: NTP pyrophosphohydrolase [Pseudoclavibacter sp.]
MTAVTIASPTGATAAVEPRVPGAIRMRERVIDKIVRESSAIAIGIARDDVNVDVAELGGGLTVRIATKIPIPDLADTEAIRAAVTVVDRSRALQSSLVETLARLTGREIRRVSITITGAIIPERKRVR